jgi:hypothetical protein
MSYYNNNTNEEGGPSGRRLFRDEGARRHNWPDRKGLHDDEVCSYPQQLKDRLKASCLINELSPDNWVIGGPTLDQFAKGWSIRRINFLGDSWVVSLHVDNGRLSAAILQDDILNLPMALAWRRWVQTKVYLSHVFDQQATESLGDAETFLVEAAWTIDGVKVALMICNADQPQIICSMAGPGSALDHLVG